MTRILIVKLWALGDILMATPMLRALKQEWPDCHITWLTDIQNTDILAHNPLIDDLLPLDTGKWRRQLRKGNIVGWARQARRLRAQMHNRQFDIAINCHPEKWWSALLCAAPVRISLYPSACQPLSRHLYTHALSRDITRHNTDDYLRTLEPIGLTGPFDRHMTLPVTPAEQNSAQSFLTAQSGYDTRRPYIILHPGTSQETKCWPAVNYAALAAQLTGRYNVVITGSPKERPLAEAIVAAMPPGTAVPFVAAGQLHSLRETIALVSQADAVVTGDTSVLHIASALEVPLVGVYGSTRPDANAPLFGRNILLYDNTVPCAPCRKSHCPLRDPDHLRCLRAVTPPQAFDALSSLLNNKTHCTTTEDFYELSSY